VKSIDERNSEVKEAGTLQKKLISRAKRSSDEGTHLIWNRSHKLRTEAIHQNTLIKSSQNNLLQFLGRKNSFAYYCQLVSGA